MRNRDGGEGWWDRSVDGERERIRCGEEEQTQRWVTSSNIRRFILQNAGKPKLSIYNYHSPWTQHLQLNEAHFTLLHCVVYYIHTPVYKNFKFQNSANASKWNFSEDVFFLSKHKYIVSCFKKKKKRLNKFLKHLYLNRGQECFCWILFPAVEWHTFHVAITRVS